MKRQWRLQRQLLPTPDGQHRWDRAYRLLLSRAEPATGDPTARSERQPRWSMRAAVYARVSTQRQAQAQTIAQQLERLHGGCAAQGWTVLDKHTFRDDGDSGASLHRPGRDRLREKVAAGEVDRVLLTAPDRLARNYVVDSVLVLALPPPW